MLIPTLKFKYSWIYDQNWKNWLKLYKLTPINLSVDQILRRIEKIQKIWSKHEHNILKEISTTSHLPWKEEEITCYVVSRCIPFSDPLTIDANRSDETKTIDILTHELIHRIFVQEGNMQKSQKAWDYFQKKYSGQSLNVITHILLHAIHMHIFLKFFDRKRLEREIKILKHLDDYRRAWEIVLKEGYQRIITDFTVRIQK